MHQLHQVWASQESTGKEGRGRRVGRSRFPLYFVAVGLRVGGSFFAFLLLDAGSPGLSFKIGQDGTRLP